MSEKIEKLRPRPRNGVAVERQKKGLSQMALAKLVRCSQTLISRIELDRYDLSYDFAVDIAEALGCDVWAIMALNGGAEWRELARCFETLDDTGRRAVILLARTLVPPSSQKSIPARPMRATSHYDRE